MSSLYQNPDELSGWKKNSKTGNILQDIYTDLVAPGLSLGEDGEVKRTGAAWWLQGASQPGARNIAEQKKAYEKAKAVDTAVQASGLTPEELRKASGGTQLNPSNVSGVISRGLKDRSQEITPAQQEVIDGNKRREEEATNARKDTTALGYATLRAQDNRLTFESTERANERSFNRKENNLNRRHERELADSKDGLQMQMALMQSDLQEKRMDYDRETARLDRRSQAIAQLMSGLGSLGGAFSL